MWIEEEFVLVELVCIDFVSGFVGVGVDWFVVDLLGLAVWYWCGWLCVIGCEIGVVC